MNKSFHRILLAGGLFGLLMMGIVRVADVNNLRSVLPDAPEQIMISPVGDQIASVADGELCVLTIAAQEPVCTMSGDANHLLWSPVGDGIALMMDGGIDIYHAPSVALVNTYPLPEANGVPIWDDEFYFVADSGLYQLDGTRDQFAHIVEFETPITVLPVLPHRSADGTQIGFVDDEGVGVIGLEDGSHERFVDWQTVLPTWFTATPKTLHWLDDDQLLLTVTGMVHEEPIQFVVSIDTLANEYQLLGDIDLSNPDLLFQRDETGQVPSFLLPRSIIPTPEGIISWHYFRQDTDFAVLQLDGEELVRIVDFAADYSSAPSISMDGRFLFAYGYVITLDEDS